MIDQTVTDVGGTVQERYLYDPYGKQAYLSGGWGSRGASSYGMVYLHQGGRYNAVNKLYSFRFRDYSADLGRWMQQDPAGYVDGASLYGYVSASPVGVLDPYGLQPGGFKPPPLAPGIRPREGSPVKPRRSYDHERESWWYPDDLVEEVGVSRRLPITEPGGGGGGMMRPHNGTHD